MEQSTKNKFRKQLLSIMPEGKTITTQELYSHFGDMNSQTVSWHLHQELKKGFIEKCGHGQYRLSASTPVDQNRLSNIPALSQSAYQALKASGIDYYLSGLDCLNGMGFKIDGSYPVILCTPKSSTKEAQTLLMRQYDLALAITESDEPSGLAELRSRIQFLILSSSNFSLQRDCFAFPEKAFVDLYYATTRMAYPLPIKELAHLYSLISPNAYRFYSATKDRGLQNELNFLLSHNKEFLQAIQNYL